jgi:hypothetical protein
MSALAAALASGFINYGANRVNFQWLRRDIDAAHERLDRMNAPTAYTGRKSPKTSA